MAIGLFDEVDPGTSVAEVCGIGGSSDVTLYAEGVGGLLLTTLASWSAPPSRTGAGATTAQRAGLLVELAQPKAPPLWKRMPTASELLSHDSLCHLGPATAAEVQTDLEALVVDLRSWPRRAPQAGECRDDAAGRSSAKLRELSRALTQDVVERQRGAIGRAISRERRRLRAVRTQRRGYVRGGRAGERREW